MIRLALSLIVLFSAVLGTVAKEEESCDNPEMEKIRLGLEWFLNPVSQVVLQKNGRHARHS